MQQVLLLVGPLAAAEAVAVAAAVVVAAVVRIGIDIVARDEARARATPCDR